MALPKVEINVLNNQLGTVAGTDDGVSGLIMSGVAVPGNISLLEAKQIFSTDDAEALGLDAAYDTANSTEVWKHIRDFYREAGQGTELWIMLVVNTTTMEDMADLTGSVAPALLDAASGRIRLLGLTRVPDGAYTPSYTDEIDDDIIAAIANLQLLAEDYAENYQPLRCIIEGRDYQGTTADLLDLRARTDNRVMGVLGSDDDGGGAAVGYALGRAAGNPVQRKIARVKDGPLSGVSAAYLSDGTAIEDLSLSAQGNINDKGWVFLRYYQGKSGYFFNNDHMACAITDDYAYLGRGRVIDKAITITYQTYVDELLDDLEVDPDTGYLAPSVIKEYQGNIENAINTNMTGEDEISGVRAVIDPQQNILSTNELRVTLYITPKGYSEDIVVSLGFENAAN